MLLLAVTAGEAAFGAVERPQKWRPCGSLDLPHGFSPLRHDGSRRVRLDSSGSLHCSCSYEDPDDSESLKIYLADREGSFFTDLNMKVYPCLSAACTRQRTTSSGSVVNISDFTSVELLPSSCARNTILRKADNARVEISVGKNLSELQARRCGRSSSISLSQKLTSLAGSVRVRWLVPLDMGSCAEPLIQNASLPFTTWIVFQNSNEQELPHLFSPQSQHAIVRRSNNPPSFLSSYYSAQVAENSPLGTLVATAEASDIDEGIDGELTYSMVPSSNHISADYFQIHNVTGEITTTGELTIDTIQNSLGSVYNKTMSCL